jgi:hypothetical protein
MDFRSSSNIAQSDDFFTYRERHAHRHDVMERCIEIGGSFITSMLALRFILALLGANASNGFASFINTFTAPFVTPFYNLFSYDHPSVGIATFEGYALVAMLVYGMITGVLAKIVSVTRYE